jgi:hypothetical protein
MLRALLIGLAAAAVAAPTLRSQPRPHAHWPAHARIAVWLDPRDAPPAAELLLDRALAMWMQAADGRFVLERSGAREAAGVRVRFARADGVYGETMPRIDRTSGDITSADVIIAGEPAGDVLQQRIIVYLTALHELGHALGLPHTDAFDDIMYSFRRPDDGERYFGAYRRRLRSIEDIGSARATGLSPADVAALRTLYDR